MPALLHLLSYVGAVTAFIFVTLSLASGLLWIAELIEEHSRLAKTIGVRAIYAIIVLHALLFVTDGLPFWYSLFGIFCHVVYLQHFSRSWPFISLTSPTFIVSCVLVVTDHFLWFFHFAAIAQEAKKYRAPKYRYSHQANVHKDPPTFLDVATFFAICVWFIPLFLFLSLSANDNVIPSFGSSAPSTPVGSTIDLSGSPMPRTPGRSSTSLVKSMLNPIFNVLPRLGRRGRADEGIIAPRIASPVPSVRHSQESYAPWGSDSSGLGAPQPSPPPTMYSSQGMLDSRLNGVAASRITTPPPRRPGVSKRNSVSSNFDEDESIPLSPSASSLRQASAARSRSTTESTKKAD